MDAPPETKSLHTAASQFRDKRVHFIGIGGSGMSGLARMLIDVGAKVTGSESNPSPQTFDLARRGAKISRDQMGELLDQKVDLVVRTAAVRDDNCEMIAARALGLSTLKYAELLGLLMSERHGIAVAGTHGKSTTSAMISFVLSECGLNPSFVIGGTVPQLGGGSRSGESDVFVAEACEYDRSFHNLRPKIAVITNIEEDHLDCYKDIEEIVASFRVFAQHVPEDGLIIAHGGDVRVRQALANLPTHVEWVGWSSEFDWAILNFCVDNGSPSGDLFRAGKLLGTLRLKVAGEHNIINAAMATAACVSYGVPAAEAIEALGRFTGVDRRMTLIGQFNGANVVDDYGHHPTEVRATLKALRGKYNPKRLLCVFQPHQHSRTRFLLEDFAASFALADETIVPDIYFVRDSQTERQRVSAADLVTRIRASGQAAQYLPSFEQIADYLRKTARAGDLIVTMGAGNVWEIARDLAASPPD
jgi:UDP-N-acetylmuramate--alanine ligase